MIGRLTSQEANRIKETFLARLGLTFSKIADSLYNIDGKRVNIKIARALRQILDRS